MRSYTNASIRRGSSGRIGARRAGSSRVAASLLAALAGITLLAGTVRAQGGQGKGTGGADYPYVPTPPDVVAEMLELADVSDRDTVYDLGSGDGRIVVTAARRYGSAGVGVELDSSLVAEARRRAASEGVEDLVRFVRGDLFDTDVTPATVVALYLLPRTMEKLEPVLFSELRPGARVVAHDFDMEEWSADSVASMTGGLGGHATLYLWRVPARVGGTWEVTAPGHDAFRVRIDQKFQELRARTPGETAPRVTEARVSGDSVRLNVVLGSDGDDGRAVGLHGTVDGDRMGGRVEAEAERGPGEATDGDAAGRTAGEDDGEGWSARRVADSDPSPLTWSGERGDGAGADADTAASRRPDRSARPERR